MNELSQHFNKSSSPDKFEHIFKYNLGHVKYTTKMFNA